MGHEKESMNELKEPINTDFLAINHDDGMPGLVDSTIALEFLLSMKTGIRNSAAAITEIGNPRARAVIHTMLNDMIGLLAEISDLMIGKGWLNPYDIKNEKRM